MKKISFKQLKYSVSALLIIFSSIISSTAAFATDGKYDEQFYSNNNITIYNPADGGCGASGSGSVGPIGSLSGSDNEQKIFNFWITAGLSPAQAAGITGNLKAESGFSPFRQEESQSWPSGGYGIAQFTGEQRVNVTGQLSSSLGATFTQYYSDQYGGGVSQQNGYVPSGVPTSVNDQFLLGELNYLLTYISTYDASSNNVRTGDLQSDWGMTVPNNMKLLAYMKTLTTPQQAAEAWVTLYEYPADIPDTGLTRAGYASDILTQANGGSSLKGSAINCAASSFQCNSPTGDSTTTNTSASSPSGPVGGAAAIVSAAQCLTFQPAQGSKTSKTEGMLACEGKSGSDASQVNDTGVCVGPTAPPAYAAARRTYKTAGSDGTNDAFDNYGGDCGNFVATVMRASGADPNYPISGVGTLEKYMETNTSKYQAVGEVSAYSNLQPGDIIVQNDDGHIMIYIGNGQIAQASQGEEMPIQEGFWEGGRVYRVQ